MQGLWGQFKGIVLSNNIQGAGLFCQLDISTTHYRCMEVLWAETWAKSLWIWLRMIDTLDFLANGNQGFDSLANSHSINLLTHI
jgi:hypothetical protein